MFGSIFNGITSSSTLFGSFDLSQAHYMIFEMNRASLGISSLLKYNTRSKLNKIIVSAQKTFENLIPSINVQIDCLELHCVPYR